MSKKQYIWTKSLEFEHILEREQKKIKGLLENPIFRSDWESARSSKRSRPSMRQNEMKLKQQKFCKKYELSKFPISLSSINFIPEIGPNLEFGVDGLSGKITSVKWLLNGTTSQQDKTRMLKYVQQFEDAISGKLDSLHSNRQRDMAFYDEYYGKKGTKIKGITYYKIALKWVDNHVNIFKAQYLKDYDEQEDRQAYQAAWKAGVRQFAQVVKIAISREKKRRKNHGIK